MFITEIPLIVDSKQESELLSRFQAARQLYNACLNEAMVRMNLGKQLRDISISQNYIKKKNKKRSDAFIAARKGYRYSDYELQAYATIVSNKSKWIAENIDSNTQQTLATRAFRSSEKVLLGTAKKVRYKVASRLRSVEGKTNKQGIRWKNNQLVWGKLKLTAIIDYNNPVIQHGLKSPVKYVRLLWRELNGKRRWYIQLVTEGVPYHKEKNYISDGVIGLDLNIYNIAFVGDKQAGLLPFADKVPSYARKIKALQQAMQRSQRAINPENYEPNFQDKVGRKVVTKKGKAKKGKQRWNKSKAYIKAAHKKREIERKKAAYSKSQNRKIVNEILKHGKHIKTENVSVKAWQKRYGKAISAKSPGFVQSELKRKAESAGGSFTKFSTSSTALSQTHLNGERIKKSLSERVHYDVTGVIMHRDLFSAYLSRFVNDEDSLLLHLALSEWERSEPYLMQAWEEFQINCEQLGESESRLSHSPSEQFCIKLRTVNQIAIFRAKS
ncbi:transposase, IS608 family protein [Microseira wollei NIES-4236]|uniref:Transposase, IS608 family protein n=1 Tax=Microseira wollei NIES-4236 TaxID=2530354 RepID=A0AAV3WQN9_9CYAN|nr:transposase [Microseira wollei]GET44544.1 transposase, IS608 family protein [Microseira wollei NIES-4236]